LELSVAGYGLIFAFESDTACDHGHAVARSLAFVFLSTLSLLLFTTICEFSFFLLQFFLFLLLALQFGARIFSFF
jgi:hypothetical protein